MNRFATSLVALTLAFAATACEDAPTNPDDDYDPEDYAQHDISVRDPGFGFELPPLEPQPTFWSCAAGHEGNFADAAARIIQLETKAWFESDYRIQQALLQQVAKLKAQAKAALLFGIQQCVNQYGAPLLWLVQDENGNWVRMVFSVEAYYRYIVEKYLERA